jgi:hypothetical protein
MRPPKARRIVIAVAFWRYPERGRRIDGDDSGTFDSAARMHGAGGAKPGDSREQDLV